MLIIIIKKWQKPIMKFNSFLKSIWVCRHYPRVLSFENSFWGIIKLVYEFGCLHSRSTDGCFLVRWETAPWLTGKHLHILCLHKKLQNSEQKSLPRIFFLQLRNLSNAFTDSCILCSVRNVLPDTKYYSVISRVLPSI